MAAAALLWLSISYHLHQKRHGDMAQARRDVNNMSIALTAQISRLVEGADQVLRLMQEDFQRDPDHFDLGAWIGRSTSLRAVANQIALFDRNGNLKAAMATEPQDASVNIADRPMFARLSTQGEDRLFIGRTYESRIRRAIVLPLARRVLGRDGTFRGIIVVSLDPQHLAREFKALDVGANGSVTLFGEDGFVRARAPAVSGMYDRSGFEAAPRAAVFAALMQSGSSLRELPAAYDAMVRIYAFRVVDGRPLFLSVGLSVEEVLAPFHQEAVRIVSIGIAATAVIVALLLLLRWEERRGEARERALVATNTALLEAEAKFRGVFESSPDGLSVIGIAADGVPSAETMNLAMVEARGTGPHYHGRLLEDLLPPQAFARARRSIEHVVASGEALRVQADVFDDGRNCEVILVPLTFDKASGRVSRVFISIRDVSHLQRAETAIAASEARYRLLAETTTDVITRIDLRTRERDYVSPNCRTLFGYEPEEMLGREPSQSMHPEDAPRVCEVLPRLVSGQVSGGQVIVTYRTRHKAGHWVWVETGMRIANDEHGNPASIVCSLRDISERQAQSEALQRAKDMAETATAAAEQASKAKTQFLAAMSHEIRTPLNAVLGYADLLLADAGLSGDRRLYLDRIQNAGSALRTVVDDILDFSKIEAGQIELAPLPFRVGALIDNALSIVRGSAQAKNLDLIVDLGPEVQTFVIGDHDRLRQILLNLLNNAIKFTRAGSVTLLIRAIRRDGPGLALRFTVEDTGIGIAEDKLGRLFQSFSQVDGSISREYGGTGLGLAVCKRLVEAMGGQVGVSSQIGRGSSFWFDVTLPPAAGSARAAHEPDGSLRGNAAAVLLVEDQQINRDLVRAVLEAAGHVVDEAPDGAAAISAILAKDYDIVLMDVQMPVMDGIEATGRIRALHSAKREVFIVALTANVLPAQVAELRKAGMDGHLGKPFRHGELLDAVARRARAVVPECDEVVALDRGVFLGLSDVIGAAALNGIMSAAFAQIATLRDIEDHAVVAARAHALLAPVGTIGLLDLAGALRDLETACLSGSVVEPAAVAVDLALSRARDATARVQSGQARKADAA